MMSRSERKTDSEKMVQSVSFNVGGKKLRSKLTKKILALVMGSFLIAPFLGGGAEVSGLEPVYYEAEGSFSNFNCFGHAIDW